jgi:hypothetical protein
MTSRTAACTCGQLSITVHGECLGNGICHCLACQSRTGSVFATLGAWAAPYEIKGRATQYVRTGDAGAQIRFNFCPVCGSTVFHTEEGTVYDSRRHHWVKVPDSVPAFARNPQ